MLKLAGVDDNIPNNIKLLQSKIDSGEGLEKFKEMISRQWGDVRVIDDPELLPKAKYRIPLNSLESGYIASFDAKVIGQAVVNLGGGRLKKEDSIDYAVGIETVKKIGDEIKEGEPILYIHANTETQGLLQIETLRSSIKISKEPVAKAKEILDIIE